MIPVIKENKRKVKDRTVQCAADAQLKRLLTEEGFQPKMKILAQTYLDGFGQIPEKYFEISGDVALIVRGIRRAYKKADKIQSYIDAYQDKHKLFAVVQKIEGFSYLRIREWHVFMSSNQANEYFGWNMPENILVNITYLDFINELKKKVDTIKVPRSPSLEWLKRAGCIDVPEEYFLYNFNLSPEQNKENIEVGKAYCEICPVKEECRSATEKKLFQFSLRGGEIWDYRIAKLTWDRELYRYKKLEDQSKKNKV